MKTCKNVFHYTDFYFLGAIFFVTIFTFVIVYFRDASEFPQDDKTEVIPPEILNNTTNMTIIYMATKFFGSPITNNILEKCSERVKTSCYITNSLSLFPRAHAVVFHSRNIKEQDIPGKFQKLPRNFEVPYILMGMESPFYAEFHKYSNFFNWTMTYRMDSDVFYPYGAIIPTNETKEVNNTEIWNSKTKTALWLVSNRHQTGNKRQELTEKMVKRGLEVDLMGKLYKEPPGCPRFGAIEEDCDVKLHSPYKFTIAFENNNCKDYVTEKFWRKALRYKMVPIVMQRSIYRNLQIPDSMYIAIEDFPKLEDFVDYIRKISKNQTEYLKFHKWREDFRIVETNEENYGFCQLCQKFGGNQKKEEKNYEDVEKWNNPDDQCDNSFVSNYFL